MKPTSGLLTSQYIEATSQGKPRPGNCHIRGSIDLEYQMADARS